MKRNQPSMNFVLDQKGLMGDLRPEVGRIPQIKKGSRFAVIPILQGP